MKPVLGDVGGIFGEDWEQRGGEVFDSGDKAPGKDLYGLVQLHLAVTFGQSQKPVPVQPTEQVTGFGITIVLGKQRSEATRLGERFRLPRWCEIVRRTDTAQPRSDHCKTSQGPPMVARDTVATDEVQDLSYLDGPPSLGCHPMII